MRYRGLETLGEKIGEFLLPRRCGLCGAATPARTICPGCYAELPWLTQVCRRCGTPLATDNAPGVCCGACQQQAPPYEVAFAPLHYAYPVSAVIKAFKFGRRLDLAAMLAAFALPWLRERQNRFDAMIPVPLNRWRNALRGFNQAQELARHLRRATGLPVRSCVRRVRRTPPQSGLTAAERRNNIKGAFRVLQPPRCRHALIVDDVMTTGETCRELTVTLLDAGVEKVSVLTIARASTP